MSLSSHVLDAVRGRPAAGVAVRWERLVDGQLSWLRAIGSITGMSRTGTGGAGEPSKTNLGLAGAGVSAADAAGMSSGSASTGKSKRMTSLLVR